MHFNAVIKWRIIRVYIARASCCPCLTKVHVNLTNSWKRNVMSWDMTEYGVCPTHAVFWRKIWKIPIPPMENAEFWTVATSSKSVALIDTKPSNRCLSFTLIYELSWIYWVCNCKLQNTFILLFIKTEVCCMAKR